MKDVVGYEGKYAIDEEGNVWSLNHRRTQQKKKMVLYTRPDGYKSVGLRKNRKKKTHNVHRLMAQVYLSDYSEELQVDHIDRDKGNNSISNLRMVTPSENQWNRKDKGYSFVKDMNKWQAYISKDRKIHKLGLHTCPVMARVAYLFAKKELHVISSHSTYDPADRSLSHKNGE